MKIRDSSAISYSIVPVEKKIIKKRVFNLKSKSVYKVYSLETYNHLAQTTHKNRPGEIINIKA